MFIDPAGNQSSVAPDEAGSLLTAVARLYYVDGLGQQQIAEITGISRSRVSRALTEARERGIVRITVADYDPRRADLEAALRGRFGLRHAIVVRASGRHARNVRSAVGHFAAPAVAALIGGGQSVGIAGGRTLRELIVSMEPRDPVPGVSVVQLMGNAGPSPTEVDAMEIGRVLALRFGGTLYTLNAPAFSQDTRTREAFLSHEHIRLIWGMFGSLKIAFVGIGSLEDSVFVERGVLAQADLAGLREAGAVGEICGRFFDARGRECATGHRDRVISIDLGVLRRCPEVVAVTNGVHRAAATRAALEGRLATSLVIDERGAEALLADAPSPAGQRRS